MKVFENNFAYDYSFPAVSLAYFLRYPNPYSRHVLTTDVIDRHVDPATGRLHTVRLHLKRSKVPKAMLKLLPAGMAGRDGSGQSYILETSTVDLKEGWMRTESRNMEFTGVLSVVEKQDFQRAYGAAETEGQAGAQAAGAAGAAAAAATADDWDGSTGVTAYGTSSTRVTPPAPPRSTSAASTSTSTFSAFDWSEKGREFTNVKTTVIFHSRLGQSIRKKLSTASSNTFGSAAATAAATAAAAAPAAAASSGSSGDDIPQSRRFSLSFWSTAGLQRTIEFIGVQRTRNALLKSKQGMGVVLERLRQGGIVGVLEGMKQDRELALLGAAGGGPMAGGGPELPVPAASAGAAATRPSTAGGMWQRVWTMGRSSSTSDIYDDDD
ncbi:hypothetical protein KEM52_003023 [Ascosphaera acerosa]|nr:hypothetical protein KEM52_003023 [Ascosphaera acerosa]